MKKINRPEVESASGQIGAHRRPDDDFFHVGIILSFRAAKAVRNPRPSSALRAPSPRERGEGKHGATLPVVSRERGERDTVPRYRLAPRETRATLPLVPRQRGKGKLGATLLLAPREREKGKLGATLLLAPR